MLPDALSCLPQHHGDLGWGPGVLELFGWFLFAWRRVVFRLACLSCRQRRTRLGLLFIQRPSLLTPHRQRSGSSDDGQVSRVRLGVDIVGSVSALLIYCLMIPFLCVYFTYPALVILLHFSRRLCLAPPLRSVSAAHTSSFSTDLVYPSRLFAPP